MRIPANSTAYLRFRHAFGFEDGNTVSTNRDGGVLANDTDPDGDDLTAAMVDNVAHGNLTFRPDGSFSYAPDQDFFGTDSFTYKVKDGAADSGVMKVTITVNPVNDPPTVEVATGGACGQSNERRATINLTVEDVDNQPRFDPQRHALECQSESRAPFSCKVG